jgi:hypothetical protein
MTNNTKIFTTGAFLKPLKVINDLRKEAWVWIVEGFEESSFLDGKEFNPPEYASRLDELLVDMTEIDEEVNV